MKKKKVISEVLKKKTRHIVSWSQEEDDILREQIQLHGTESWGIIASKFKDKTTRQCRRRWFTYLNSDFKRGGWSPEEDKLLCEAQKIYGNRWTEIAKVVSGRTDNAVKNRFNTLCKKRAKHEEYLSAKKENSSPSSYINLNNKRILSPDGLNNNDVEPLKKIRLNITENRNREETLAGEFRPPFAELSQSVDTCETDFGSQINFDNVKVLEDILKHDMYESSQGSSEYSTGSTMSNVQCNIIESCEDLRCLIVQETKLDMQYAGLMDNAHYTAANEGGDECSYNNMHFAVMFSSSHHTYEETENPIFQFHHVFCSHLSPENIMFQCEYLDAEMNLPLHATPLFRALAAAIPSPKFSESEKHFLMKTLGIDSTTTTHNPNPSQPPQCKRSLFNNL